MSVRGRFEPDGRAARTPVDLADHAGRRSAADIPGSSPVARRQPARCVALVPAPSAGAGILGYRPNPSAVRGRNRRRCTRMGPADSFYARDGSQRHRRAGSCEGAWACGGLGIAVAAFEMETAGRFVVHTVVRPDTLPSFV